jgi:hypothetical protein
MTIVITMTSNTILASTMKRKWKTWETIWSCDDDGLQMIPIIHVYLLLIIIIINTTIIIMPVTPPLFIQQHQPINTTHPYHVPSRILPVLQKMRLSIPLHPLHSPTINGNPSLLLPPPRQQPLRLQYGNVKPMGSIITTPIRSIKRRRNKKKKMENVCTMLEIPSITKRILAIGRNQVRIMAFLFLLDHLPVDTGVRNQTIPSTIQTGRHYHNQCINPPLPYNTI